MAQLLTLPLARVQDANGTVYPGAKLYIYLTGGTTPASVYTTANLTTPHPNPVVADAGGFLPLMFLDPTLVYRFVARTSAGASISGMDFDPVYGKDPSIATLETDVADQLAQNLADVTALINTISGYLQPVVNVSPPSALISLPGTWNDQIGGTYVRNDNGTWTFDRSRFDAIDFTNWATLTEYYVNYSTGNDANAGTASGSPKKTMDSAFTAIAALAAGSAAVVHCKDNHVGTLSWLGGSDSRLDNKKVKIIGEGSQGFTRKVNMREDKDQTAFSWTAHGTNGAWKSNTVGAAGEYVMQMWLGSLDSLGIPTPIVTTGQNTSTVDSTELTSYWDGTTLYVHLPGGVKPNPFLNWLYSNNFEGAAFLMDSGTLLLQNFDFVAGAKSVALNAFRLRSVTDANFVTTTRVGFKSARFYGASGNGLGMFDMAVTVVEDSSGAYCRNDIFNYHSHKSTGTKGQYQTVYAQRERGHSSGYTGFADGLTPGDSDNISTCHDGIYIVRTGISGWNSKDLGIYDVGGCFSLIYGANIGPAVGASGSFRGGIGYEQLSGEGPSGTYMLIRGGVAGYATGAPALVNTGVGTVRLRDWRGASNATLSRTSTGTFVDDVTGSQLYP